ncbi:hypothetical protein VCHA34P129_30040 [Vibrio chagasii]|nr:hypothetical protein VCHA34P129_30040 [Vibrio chagasii]CAH7191282.1 hypothetical protein VCHA52P455_20341 [Vibrio chagasii]
MKLIVMTKIISAQKASWRFRFKYRIQLDKGPLDDVVNVWG